MESKLQELTNKIYREGIEKANKEAAEIIEKARHDADRIRNEAQREAEQILAAAHQQAEDLRRNVTNEVQMSARQAISALKQRITKLIVTDLVNEPIKEVFSEKEFLKKIIDTVIRNWNPQSTQSPDLSLILPKAEEQHLGKYFEARTRELLKGGIQIQFDERMAAGFKIGPADKSFVLSFTEEDFENFFKDYLKPRTTQLLFGGK